MSNKNNNPFTNNINGRGPVQPNQQPPAQKRMGFSDINKEVVATRGVKIKSKTQQRQESDKAAKEEYRKKFEANAEKTIAYHSERSDTIVEAISSFMKMSQDKTLNINKGTIAEDVEREVRTQLLELSLELNNDENEEDNGKGSIVILSAVLKIILMYRDRINELEYELAQLKREQQKVNASSAKQG